MYDPDEWHLTKERLQDMLRKCYPHMWKDGHRVERMYILGDYLFVETGNGHMLEARERHIQEVD